MVALGSRINRKMAGKKSAEQDDVDLENAKKEMGCDQTLKERHVDIKMYFGKQNS